MDLMSLRWSYDYADSIAVDGVQYRSRLEAKWALFFQLVGWDASYEQDPTGKWLPDFAITAPDGRKVLAEVKPIRIEHGWPIAGSEYVDEHVVAKMRDALRRSLCAEAILLTEGLYDSSPPRLGVLGYRLREDVGQEEDIFQRNWEQVRVRVMPDGGYEYEFQTEQHPPSTEEARRSRFKERLLGINTAWPLPAKQSELTGKWDLANKRIQDEAEKAKKVG